MRNKSIPWIPETEYIAIFRKKIIRWYEKNKRTYPWRTTRNPFRVLIAELMLRRTKADQVRVVYNRLFKEYPDVKSLATASKKKLSKILYPLGLRWRLPSIGLVARKLKNRYQGRVPCTREELKTLPGVGEYIAGAVLSIAYNKREWIIDTNVVRVFKRYFGIKTTKEGRRDRHVIEMAKRYVPMREPRIANLALLDFASLVCMPKNPKCLLCSLSNVCYYYSLDKK